MRLPGALRPIAARLHRAAIFTDFDGTLAPIVEDPVAAQEVPGARHTLLRLARRARLVMVVTGRPSSFVSHLGVQAVGQHGLEVGPPLEVVARAAEMLEGTGFPVELKSHTLTLHYRGDPDRRDEARLAVAQVAESTGLLTMLAKMGFELRPSRRDKGDVVERLARGVGAAIYGGDDYGDIAAFDCLRRLMIPTVSVAVAGRDTPDDVLKAADIVCPGPLEWVGWLKALADS
jgi:trehalose 6-phosphate phosphatase